MACLSNTPSFTYVSVQNMVIGHKNVYYHIKNMYSNDKYFYWDKLESPYELITSNTTLDSKEGLFLVVVNNKGTFILPNQSELTINFDNSSGADNKNSLFNLVEKVDDIERKYASIDESVDGITRTVGLLRKDLNGSRDLYSKMQQTAQQIELIAQEINKEYSDSNKEDDLRQQIISYSIKINTMFSDFIKTMRDIFSDSLISSEENYQLINETNKLNDEMQSYFNHIDELIDIMSQKKETENANLLKSQKEALEGCFNNFQKTLWDSTADEVVTPTETSVLIGFATTCQARLTDLKKTCDDFLFMGIGGIIYEEIAKLNIEKNKILMSLNAITTTMRSSLSLEKSSLQAQYEDILAQLDLLESWIKEASEDGTINIIEKNILNERLENLEKESNDLTEKYDEYLETLILDQEEFTQMREEFLKYSSFYNNLVEGIKQIAEDNYFNEIERTQSITLLEEYRQSVNSFFNYLSLTLAKSESNRYTQEIDNAKGEVNLQIQEVNEKIDDLDLTIDETFKDNIIDEVERKAIQTNLNALNLQKSEVDSQYNRIIQKASMSDLNNSVRIDLDSKYNSFVEAYDSIVNEVNRILNKEELVSESDKASMDDLYDIVLNALDEYTSSANSSLIYIAENEVKIVNDSLSEDIKALKTKVDDIEVGYDDTFADNILDQAERKEIESKRKLLQIQYSDIEAQYNSISNSIYILEADKSNLTELYTSFKEKYAILNTTIDNALEKTTLLDDTDVEAINNSITEFSNALSSFVSYSNTVIENIAKEQTKQYNLNFEEKVNKLENDLKETNNFIEGSIVDNKITRIERTALTQLLSQLEVVKADIDNEYSQMMKNKNLSSSMKIKYKKAYDSYIVAYNEYVSNINILINVKGSITEAQKESYNASYSNYKTQLENFSKQHQLSINNITDNIANGLKSSMNKETREVLESLKVLEDSMQDIFNDSILSEDEKTTIRGRLNEFKDRHLEVTSKYNFMIEDLISDNSKEILTGAYTEYNSAYNELYSAIESLLNRTDMLCEEDRNILDTYIQFYNDALNDYSLTYFDMLEESTRDFVETTKNDLEQNIRDINNTITSLEDDLNSTFRDGVLTEAEKNAIKKSLASLQTEKAEMDVDYNSIYENKDLVDKSSTVHAKTDLFNAYNDYISAHSELVKIIDNLLVKEGIIDSTDQKTLDDGFEKYREKLQLYKKALNDAIDSIADKKIEDEKNERTEQYQKIETTIGEIRTTVGKNTKDLDNLKEITGESFESITPNGIINTVKESKEENGELTFARKSELNQTTEDFTFKFSEMNSKIENNITVISSEGVMVKMYDESSFDSNGSVVEGSTPVATTNINGQGMYIYKESDSTPIAYFTMDECFISNLKINGVNGGNLLFSTANKSMPKTWYVSPAETGDGTGRDSNNKADTIGDVIDEIKTSYGVYLENEEIEIKIESGKYNENVDISGFLGNGTLTLNFDTTAILYGTINIEDNTIKVKLEGHKTNSSVNGATIYSYESKEQDAITVKNAYCLINGFKAKNISSSGTSYYGAFAKFSNGASGSIGNCDLLYYETPITSEYSSQAGIWNVKGKTQYRRRVANGGIVISGGTIPSTIEGKDDVNRGLVHQSGTLVETDTMGWYSNEGGSSGGTTTGGEDGSVTETQTITKTFTLTNLRSVPEGSGLATSGFSGKMAQGKWSSYKKHRGKADLPKSALDFVASAKTIKSVSLTCHRLNTSHGSAGAVPYPRMRLKNTKDATYSDYYTDSSIKFARGDTKTIPVNNTSFKTYLLNGADELQFYVTDDQNPTSQYSHYDNVKLKITITK